MGCCDEAYKRFSSQHPTPASDGARREAVLVVVGRRKAMPTPASSPVLPMRAAVAVTVDDDVESDANKSLMALNASRAAAMSSALAERGQKRAHSQTFEPRVIGSRFVHRALH
eukprot:m.953525 g.953525  ORF g.953525 m.953525 type:complete len:113 (+) comp23871_c1_seq7:443-781(+)